MIRPEAAQALSRWRDVMIGAAVLLLGVYWAFFTGGGLLHWIGYLVMALGVVIGFAGFQRARFSAGTGGPGVVSIVEGRISYFGPLTGGIVDLEALGTLTLDPRAKPPHWLLAQPGQPPLAIPLTAEGADALFDAFASLPGIRTEHMLRQMQAGGDAPIVIWRATTVRETQARLH